MKALVSVVALLAIVSAACGGGQPVAATSPSPAAATRSAGTSPSPVTLKIGQVGGLSDAAIFIAQAEGFFKDQGLTLDSTKFASAAQMVAPLGTGELQVGGGAVSAGLFNAVGRSVGIVIAADKGNLAPGFGYEAIVVRSALVDAVRRPQDLKGRKVAISALNITPEVTLDTYLRTGGLTVKDVQLVSVPFPEMLAALQNGAIDAALPIEPFLTRIIAAGAGKVLVRDDTVVPGEQIAVILLSEGFAKDRPVAVRFMKAYIQGARFYNDAFVKKDATKRVEAVHVLAKATTLDEALFAQMAMPGIDPSGKVNLASLGTIQDWFVVHGSQKKAIDLSKAVDLSFVDQAVHELGPYR